MKTDCDFDNDDIRCPYCGFVAGGRNWRKNCQGPVGRRAGTILQGLIAEFPVV
jgi:hypothetical protein